MKHKIVTLIIILLLTIIFDIKNLKCQENSIIQNTQYHSEYIEKKINDLSNDDSMIADKDLRVKRLELIIKYNINQRYQKIHSEELEEMLEGNRETGRR